VETRFLHLAFQEVFHIPASPTPSGTPLPVSQFALPLKWNQADKTPS